MKNSPLAPSVGASDEFPIPRVDNAHLGGKAAASDAFFMTPEGEAISTTPSSA